MWRVLPAIRVRWTGYRGIATFPAVTADELSNRRDRLFDLMEPNSLFLLPAADCPSRTADIPHPFRQDSLFYHLFQLNCPLVETLIPPASLVSKCCSLNMALFVKSEKERKTILFLPPNAGSEEEKRWSQHTVWGESARQLLEVKDRREHFIILPNTVPSIYHTLVKESTPLIQSLASQRVAALTGERQITLTDLKTFNPLPRFYLHYPRQLSFTGQRFLLSLEDIAPSEKSSIAFHHPLEALLALIVSSRINQVFEDPILLKGAQNTTPIRAVESRWELTKTFGNASSALLQARDQLRGKNIPELSKSILFKSEKNADNPSRERQVVSLTTVIHSSEPLANRYRYIKSPTQLQQHLISAEYTRIGFISAMQEAARTHSEADVQCSWEQTMSRLKRGLSRQARRIDSAYIPVIAGGTNSAQIHYTHNGQVHPDNVPTVMRMDAGYEVDGVPTDCTRTFPLGQKAFTPAHAQLYTLLLQLQRKLLLTIKDGVTVADVAKLHIDETRNLLLQLRDSKTTTEGPQEVSLASVRNVFCPHSFGHFFGLDIHETPAIEPAQTEDGQKIAQRGAVLAGGVMHTVEPGVYLSEEEPTLPLSFPWRGLGMQVEDDVLVLPSSKRARDTYLSAALQVYEHIMNDPSPLEPFGGSLLVQSAALRAESQRVQQATQFLYDQRCSIEGSAVAREKLTADVLAVKADVASSEKEGLHFEWFPFDIIVVTARIPKDLDHLEMVMKANL